MVGRPRKPTALKLLQGDFDKDPQRQNHNEPVTDSLSPDCPEYLLGDAREEWLRLSVELGGIKVLSTVDRSALEQYCQTYGYWRDCCRDIAKGGLFIKTPIMDRGGNQVGTQTVENPAANAARKYGDQIQRLLAQFGLTPAARTRLTVEKETPAPRMRRQR
jgi:P27 family predicted phage terminase small subunit